MPISSFQKKKSPTLILPTAVFLFITCILTFVQLKVENPLLLAERFQQGAGWIEIALIGFYGAFLAYKMLDPKEVARWRIISWTVFSIVFFSQLIVGILVSEKFLMTGKLHIPVPALIIAGPIFRGQISVMTLLFFSTVILTGPAWCSHLCYFGSIDGLFSRNTINRGKIKKKMPLKHTGLLLIILVTILLRIFGVGPLFSTILGILVGLAGLILIFSLSGKKGKMIHCIMYCPVGTLVNYLKFLNPFRLKININCSFCGSCSSICRYDALSLADLSKKTPGITCTLCGDCVGVCESNSIYYKLFRFSPYVSRQIYLFLTLSIHAIFLALARI